jgi:hypothetical protein
MNAKTHAVVFVADLPNAKNKKEKTKPKAA